MEGSRQGSLPGKSRQPLLPTGQPVHPNGFEGEAFWWLEALGTSAVEYDGEKLRVWKEVLLALACCLAPRGKISWRTPTTHHPKSGTTPSDSSACFVWPDQGGWLAMRGPFVRSVYLCLLWRSSWTRVLAVASTPSRRSPSWFTSGALLWKTKDLASGEMHIAFGLTRLGRLHLPGDSFRCRPWVGSDLLPGLQIRTHWIRHPPTPFSHRRVPIARVPVRALSSGCQSACNDCLTCR